MGHLTAWFDGEFLRLKAEWRELIQAIEPQKMYQRPSARELSFAEHVVRSAGAVEQTFDGITANLWDDPFEWTLPETLPTTDKVSGYLDEVEATRKHGFRLFKSDVDLVKEIMVPSGPTQLLPLLLDTLARAAHHQGRAWATFEILRAAKRD